MTHVGDEIIKLLELGDLVRWVTTTERVQALELLKSDAQFDSTIAQLFSKGLFTDFLFQYSGRLSSPSLFDLVMVCASRGGRTSVSMIEGSLRGLYFRDRDASILQGRFGMAPQVFALASDLAISMRNYGLLSYGGGRVSTAATVPTDPKASFSGSGATGRDISDERVPASHQARILIEQKANPQADPGASGPISRRYSNPLWGGLTLPSSAQERLRQAARITSLPIATLFDSIYLNGRPSRSAIMRVAARKYRLTPEVIGAIILAEQRDQSRNEDKLDYTAATHLVARRTTSIGLGQVRDDTAQRTDLFSGLLERRRRQALNNSQIATLLTSDEFNIFAVAKYIRHVADLVGKKTAKDLPYTARIFPGINFGAYARAANTWPSANVAALGAEYTSRPWDDRVTGWGSFVGEAFADMSGAAIRW